ncbi:hypothetical protein [Priestia megaterium]|uniref:hypothetical protein n=1 Tax=Priestia megaterium TaxID=1404 RepID=UPI000BF5AD7D|nr:hypothetical protein [Priestia megaterium]PFW47272.1 hypothetical protein COL17_22115 [Priestia megaterium]
MDLNLKFRDEMLQHTTVIINKQRELGSGVLTIIKYQSRCFFLTCYHCVKGYETKDLKEVSFLVENTKGKKWLYPEVKAMFYNGRKDVDLVAFEVDISFFNTYRQKQPLDMQNHENKLKENSFETVVAQSFSITDGKNINKEDPNKPEILLLTTVIAGKIYETRKDMLTVNVPVEVDYRGFSGSAVYREADKDNSIFCFCGIACEWNEATSQLHIITIDKIKRFLSLCQINSNSQTNKIPVLEIDL